MRTFFRVLACLVASVLAVLFIGYSLVYVGLAGLYTKALTPATYKEPLVKARVYERFAELAGKEVAYLQAMPASTTGVASAKGGGDGGLGFLKDNLPRNLKESDAVTLVNAFVPADWLRRQVESVIDLVPRIMQRKSGEKLDVAVDLREVKARLKSEQGVEVVMGILKSRPEGTWTPPSENASLVEWADSMLASRPPPEVLDKVKEQLKGFQQDIDQKIPDTHVLIGGEAEGLDEADDQELAFVTACRNWGWIISVVLLLLVLAFGARSRRGLCLWSGIPLLVAGLLMAGLASQWCCAFQLNLFDAQVATLFMREGEAFAVLKSNLAPEIWGLLVGLRDQVFFNLMGFTRLAGGWAIAAGVVLIAAGCFASPPRERKPGE